MLLQTATYISMPLKHRGWPKVTEGGGTEACLHAMLVCPSFWTSEMVLLCESHNYFSFFFFSSAFFPLMLSTGLVIAECPNLAHSTHESCSSFPWCTGHVLLWARLFMVTSEEIVCPKGDTVSEFEKWGMSGQEKRRLCSALSASGYKGWICFELKNPPLQ